MKNWKANGRGRIINIMGVIKTPMKKRLRCRCPSSSAAPPVEYQFSPHPITAGLITLNNSGAHIYFLRSLGNATLYILLVTGVDRRLFKEYSWLPSTTKNYTEDDTASVQWHPVIICELKVDRVISLLLNLFAWGRKQSSSRLISIWRWMPEIEVRFVQQPRKLLLRCFRLMW